ncbi:MAG TPA: hypothetical protein VFT55_14620, partial [Planctomycetota bacterium]|nr:hypothetical protein [Planctomycetota bacterium]
MHESQESTRLGNRLAATPWLMTAIMLHVAAVAIASILYYTHGSAIDDTMPTEIALTTRPPETPELKPPEIVNIREVPQIAFEDDERTDNVFDPMIDMPVESTNESDVNAELAALRGTDGSGSAIGPGQGFWGTTPSTKPPGRPSGTPGKYVVRFPPGGRTDHTDDAVMRGLIWLKNHQDADGRWDAD